MLAELNDMNWHTIMNESANPTAVRRRKRKGRSTQPITAKPPLPPAIQRQPAVTAHRQRRSPSKGH